MPGGDRTGPLGMGPATGRGAGYCRGYGAARLAGRLADARFVGRGRGFGGGGYGRGWRHRFFATGVPGWACSDSTVGPASVEMTAGRRNRERHSLEQQAEYLKRELEVISQRLDGLNKDGEA